MAEPIRLPLDVRKEIAQDLAGWVNASDATKGTITDWWRVCESVHLAQEGEVWGTGEDEDGEWEVNHRPLSQPRLDALTAQVTGVIGRQPRTMLDVSDDRPLASSKNEAVQRVWTDAKIKKRLRSACDITVNTDIAFMRFCPLGRGRLEIQVIHPNDMAVFPALPQGQEMATLVGHRIEQPRRYILGKIKRGEYYGKDDPEAAPSTGRVGTEDVATRASGTNPPGASGPRPALDQPVEIWDAIVRLDLDDYRNPERNDDEEYTGDGEKLYRVTFVRTEVQLLHLEEYTLPESWYIETRLLGGLPFWPVRSVGRNLLGLQSEYNNLWSLHYDAVGAAAGPAVFGPAPDQKFTTYSRFQIIDSDQPATSYFSPSVHAEVGSIPVLLARIEQNADIVARISKNTTGADVSQQTATEAQIVASGVAVGLEDYIETFGSDLDRAARVTEAIIYADYDEFAKRFSFNDADPEGGEEEAPDALLAPAPAPQQALPPGDPSAMLGTGAPNPLLAALMGANPQPEAAPQ